MTLKDLTRNCLTLFFLLAVGHGAAVGDDSAGVRTWGGQDIAGEHKEIVLPLSYELPCLDGHKNTNPWLLLGVGAALAPVAYELGVMWHEGSHALWATGFGAHVTNYNPFPSMQNGSLQFGYTEWTGPVNDSQRAVIFIAPKITDLTLLSAYTLTNEFGLMPKNKWGQLVINMLAVAAVVDLGHDLFQTSPFGDIPQFYKNAHVTNSTPLRLIQAGLTLGGAVEVGHGIYNLFAPAKITVPKKRTTDFSAGPYIGADTLGVAGTF